MTDIAALDPFEDSLPEHVFDLVSEYLRRRPVAAGAVMIAELVVALQTGKPFALYELVELDDEPFVLALKVLAAWARLEAHSRGHYARNLSIAAPNLN